MSAAIACAWCGEPIVASQSRATHLMGGPSSQRVHDHCRDAVLRICDRRDLLEHERTFQNDERAA